MIVNNRKATIAMCISIIILLSISVSIVLVNFFTKHNKITKEMIVGVNPVASTRTKMIYQEPLTVIIKQEEKETISKQEEIEVTEGQENISIEAKVDFEDKIPEDEVEIKIKDIVDTMVEAVIEEVAETEEKKELIPTEYEGFATIGKIEIPQTGVNTFILNQVTVKGMEKVPCLLYATGELNQNGNNLIVGHNYRNGTIFSDNKNLKQGDKIYITSLEGKRVEYTIYSKFVTTAEDVSYIKRDTNNKPEITLSCCTDDDEYRIIILARIED